MKKINFSDRSSIENYLWTAKNGPNKPTNGRLRSLQILLSLVVLRLVTALHRGIIEVAGYNENNFFYALDRGA